ncbi:hypothetical protein B0H14DRAFT_2674247 [Mycena olivaceomarginata]|nr:hypothetical protein B0H14DRAFT_2674247 [Mycena olivaceomarginata]
MRSTSLLLLLTASVSVLASPIRRPTRACTPTDDEGGSNTGSVAGDRGLRAGDLHVLHGRLVLLRREYVPAGRAPVGRLYPAAGSRHERRAEILVFLELVFAGRVVVFIFKQQWLELVAEEPDCQQERHQLRERRRRRERSHRHRAR